MARVYRYKHGWIRLDHEAASVPDPSGLNPVKGEHLARRSHIVAGHKDGQFTVLDKKSGKTGRIPESAARDLHKGGRVITAVGDEGKVQSSTAEALHHAEKATGVAKKVEPSLSKLAQDLADAHGGTLKGMDFKLKTTDSLARKLDAEVADAKPPGSMTIPEALEKMFDINRYTTVIGDGDYAGNSQKILDKLRSDGHTLKVKNYWNNKDNPYQGINVQVTSPDGHQFEFQYHTPQSLETKEKYVHPLYEKQRLLDPVKDKAQYDALSGQMAKLYESVPVPPDIASVA